MLKHLLFELIPIHTIHWVNDPLPIEDTKPPSTQKASFLFNNLPWVSTEIWCSLRGFLTNHMYNGGAGSPDRVPVTWRALGLCVSVGFNDRIAFQCPPGTTQTGDLQHCRGQRSTPATSLPYVHRHRHTLIYTLTFRHTHISTCRYTHTQISLHKDMPSQSTFLSWYHDGGTSSRVPAHLSKTSGTLPLWRVL